jgi:hypothetical protein
MTLVRHLVWSDIRHFRQLLALFMALIALSTAIDAYMPELALQRGTLASIGFTTIILWLAEGVLTALLVARIVQADRLVGTTAFWMTRPIAPLALFAAKATVILLVAGLWPVLCEVALMMFHRVPAGQIALGALQDFGSRALILLALMSVAALTANVTRFLAVCASVIVLAAIATTVYAAFEARRYELVGVVMRAGGSTVAFTARVVYDHTRDILRVAFTIGALLALIVVQYRYRSLGRSILIGATGILLALGMAQLGRYPIVLAESRPPEWAKDLANLRLGVESARLDVAPTVEWGMPIGAVKVQARGELAAVAPGWLAGARLARASVQLADGSRIDGLPVREGLLLPDELYGPGQLHVVKDVLGVTRLEDDYGGRGLATLFVARPEDVSRVSTGPVTYEGTFEIDLTRVTLAASLPLQRGVAFQDGSYRVVIGDVTPNNGALVIGVRHSELQTVFDRKARPGYSFYLRNRVKDEAASGVLISDGPGHTVPFLFGLHLYRSSSAGFAVYPGQLRFRARPGQRRIDADLTDEWLRDAELVIVKSEYDGTVERTLVLEKLEIPAPRKF